MGLWDDWVLSVLPDITCSPVLEIGHGPGHLQKALSQSSLQVVGLDLSYQMNSSTCLKLKKLGIGKPTLINGYAQFLPFNNEAFGLIVSTFPADYIFEPATISEIWRALRPGGGWVWLPTAWITGTDFRSRALAALFLLTQQAPSEIGPLPDDLVSPIKHTGFKISQELRYLHNSVVLIVTARKPKC